jgi:hypothetical protein
MPLTWIRADVCPSLGFFCLHFLINITSMLLLARIVFTAMKAIIAAAAV